MTYATIQVSGARACAIFRKRIPAGLIGGEVRFEFDSEWESRAKTVVFRGVVTKDVILADGEDTAVIPAEVVASPTFNLKVGVYGTDRQGRAVPTLWADLGRVHDATDPSGDETTDPSLPVWAQLQKEIEELQQNGGGGNSSGGGGLPAVNEFDDGKVLMVAGGKWAAQELPKYEGAYVVTPAPQDQALATAQTYLDADIRVEKIPYAEVTNNAGGMTATIGGN